MKLPGHRYTIRSLMIASALLAVVLAVQMRLSRIIETLDSPVGVKGWSEKGLILDDGRVVALRGIKTLPKSSVALTVATSRGVEVGAQGRVYGLVRIHHWCGNDPIRFHLARVELSEFMHFLREGETDTKFSPDLLARMAMRPGGEFSDFGWRLDEYLQFRGWRDRWESSLDELRGGPLRKL